MYYRKLVSVAVALLMALSAVWVVSATPKTKDENEQRRLQTIEPLNLAILIQDDLVPQVSNEIGVTRNLTCAQHPLTRSIQIDRGVFNLRRLPLALRIAVAKVSNLD